MANYAKIQIFRAIWSFIPHETQVHDNEKKHVFFINICFLSFFTIFHSFYLFHFVSEINLEWLILITNPLYTELLKYDF